MSNATMSNGHRGMLAVATILTTAGASMPMGAPQGPLYMALQEALGLTLEGFQAAVGILVRAGLAVASAEVVRLTPAGVAKAAELDLALALSARASIV